MTIRPPATRLFPIRFRRRGFSFTEILFAVMILGIGFIMVVAIFPVALQQTENSQAETVGTAVVRAGVSYVSQNAATTFVDQSNVSANTALVDFSILRPTVQFLGPPADDYKLYGAALSPGSIPPNSNSPELVGNVWSFDSVGGGDVVAYLNDLTHTKPLSNTQALPNVLWPMMAQNMIHAADPRYAWVAFYRRNLIQTAAFPNQVYSYAPSAQIIVIALKSQAKQFYDQSDLVLQSASTSPYYPTSIQPSLGNATIKPPQNGDLSFKITFIDTVLQSRAAEGAFVIISSDRLNPNVPIAGTLNGHIYKLGARVVDANNTTDTWEFAPGYGPQLPVGGSNPQEYDFIVNKGVQKFVVYMVGKAIDPNDKAKLPTNYAGQAQDIAAYSTFISCPGN